VPWWLTLRPDFFTTKRKTIMAEKKKKPDQKPARPTPNGHIPRPRTSSIPGYGGSRQGNIGHEGNDGSDNAHR